MNYEEGLMLSKHLNLNSKQKIQLIQAINDHRDKSYDIIEGSTQPLILFDSNDKKKIANREEESKKVELKVKIGTEAEAESGDEDEVEEEAAKDDDDDDDQGDDDDDDDDDDEQEDENDEGEERGRRGVTRGNSEQS